MKQVQGQTLDIVKNYTEYKGCTFCFPEMYLQEDMLVDITVNMWYEEKAVYCPTGSVFDNCSFRDDIDIFPCSSRFTNCNFSRRLHLYLEFCEKEKYGSSGLEEFVTDLTITNDETCGKPWRTTPTNILTHFPKIKLQRFPLLTTFNMTHHHLRSLPNEPFARGVETINFSHNNIEEEYVEILTEPPIPVKNFNFAHNQITSLYGISVLSSLEKLNAAYNQISALPEEIKTLTNLTSLNLAKNNLSNLANIIDHLAPLKNLRELCIKGNPLSDEDISSLQKELPHVSVKDYLQLMAFWHDLVLTLSIFCSGTSHLFFYIIYDESVQGSKLFLRRSAISQYIPAWQIRAQFCKYLSDLYAKEVPLYKKLSSMVRQINKEVIEKNPELGLNIRDVEVISAERHGAIRLGKPQELHMIAKVFRVMAMHPVDFYDLTKSGAKRQPVISTSFRPISLAEIEKSSFRMFVSLLQPDDRSFFSREVGEEIKKNLAGRDFFSAKLRELLAHYEAQGGFTQQQVDIFIQEAAKIFTWSQQATNRKLYNHLIENGLAIAADIACFANPHLNHLTPNSLDISKLYDFMAREIPDNLKDSIEGPPLRKTRILLRQTSYKAVVEEVLFIDESGESAKAFHKARFGEIEERGMAMTAKGKELYEQALKKYMDNGNSDEFAVIPDSHDVLYKEKLGYYMFHASSQVKNPVDCDIDKLVANGDVEITPIRYEDFLPVSAAGIFASNLGNYGVEKITHEEVAYTKEQLQDIIGSKIYDSFSIYEQQSTQSLIDTYKKLGIWDKVVNKEQLQAKIETS